MPAFADRFIELRGNRTQDEFSKFLGISRPTVGFYESGQRIPDALVLRQISEKCNVSADYLLGLTDEKTPEQDIQAICKKTGLNEKSVSRIIHAKESKLNSDGSFFELLNELIDNSTLKEDSPYIVEHSFLTRLLRCMFDYKNALKAKHILWELANRLFEEELTKLGEGEEEKADQCAEQRFEVERKKKEKDTQIPESIRDMIFLQNCIDEAPRLYDDNNNNDLNDLIIKTVDIYKNRVIQCIIDELAFHERPYINEP